MKYQTYAALSAVALGLGVSGQALACSGCGCTLNTEDATLGPSPGWHVDERVDFINQNRLTIGGRAAPTQDPSAVEVQKYTVTLFYTTTIDYQADGPWGVNVAVPVQWRIHSTANDGADWSQSKSGWNDLSDIRVLGRYTGLTDGGDFGLQAGFKLPTGKTNEYFGVGTTDQIVDRGLQPGTGTWDVLLGFFKNGHLTDDVHWFASGMWQRPLAQYQQFAEGQKITGSLGVRYTVSDTIIPQLQINAQNRWRDQGLQADIPNSGGEVVYLSPGIFVNVIDNTSLYGFVQVPIYQRAGGLELVADYTASFGVKHKF